MRSPFPGMDPFLESSGEWLDFHATWINYAREAIAARLPSHYRACIEEKFRLVEVPTERGMRRPDITIVRTGTAAAPATSRAGVAILDAPVPQTVTRFEEVEEVDVVDRWIEIRRLADRAVVTAIELLSPTHKVYSGRVDYLAKCRALSEQSVNLVEIDLLLEGRRPPVKEKLSAGDYYVFVTRAERRPQCEVYAWSIREPLRVVPIPLRPPDADVPLDLAGVGATVYERGQYWQVIDYNAPLELPLAPDDRAWAEATARASRS